MGLVELKGIEVYAYHGVHPTEQEIGQWYVVDVSLETDFRQAENTDLLSGTIDYSEINQIVLNEMKISSKLIEHVGGRIKLKIKTKYPAITAGTVKITKLNPPVDGKINSVNVIISL